MAYQRVEVLSGAERRRTYTPAEKVRMVEEAFRPGVVVTEAARRLGVHETAVSPTGTDEGHGDRRGRTVPLCRGDHYAGAERHGTAGRGAPWAIVASSSVGHTNPAILEVIRSTPQALSKKGDTRR